MGKWGLYALFGYCPLFLNRISKSKMKKNNDKIVFMVNIWESYVKQCSKIVYINLKNRSVVKVVFENLKWYALLIKKKGVLDTSFQATVSRSNQSNGFSDLKNTSQKSISITNSSLIQNSILHPWFPGYKECHTVSKGYSPSNC